MFDPLWSSRRIQVEYPALQLKSNVTVCAARLIVGVATDSKNMSGYDAVIMAGADAADPKSLFNAGGLLFVHAR
jgi:hypothetical protein